MNYRGLLRRVEALEKKTQMGMVTLTMPNGIARQIQQRRIFPLIGEALGWQPMSDDARAVMDSISDNGVDVGMGHMCELIRVCHAAGIAADAQ